MVYLRDSFDPSLQMALGHDPALMEELNQALADNARVLADLLARARCDANWLSAAERLSGLAASFGARKLMDAARLACDSAPGDPVAIRAVTKAIAGLD